MDTVTNLASGMLTCAPEHILSWQFIHEDWDEGLVKQIGQALSATAAGFRIDMQTSSFAQLQQPFKQRFQVRCHLSRRAPVRLSACPPAACHATCRIGSLPRGLLATDRAAAAHAATAAPVV